MIKPNVKYTFAELERIRTAFPGLTLEYPGYAWRMEMDGTMMLVRWDKATSAALDGDRAPVARASTHPDLQSESLPPIVKRTPQQRLESVMAKVRDDFMAGRVLTLDEVDTHRDGRPKATELTGEVVKEVIADFLQTAENINEAAEDKKVVRTSPTD